MSINNSNNIPPRQRLRKQPGLLSWCIQLGMIASGDTRSKSMPMGLLKLTTQRNFASYCFFLMFMSVIIMCIMHIYIYTYYTCIHYYDDKENIVLIRV